MSHKVLDSFFLREFCNYYGYKLQVNDNIIGIAGADKDTVLAQLSSYALRYADSGDDYLALLDDLKHMSAVFNKNRFLCELEYKGVSCNV